MRDFLTRLGHPWHEEIPVAVLWTVMLGLGVGVSALSGCS